MWRRVAFALVALAACGKESKTSTEKVQTAEATPTAQARPTWEKVKRPPVSPACQEARRAFGYAATCVETELPELETAAGKVLRLHDPADPVRVRRYALLRPTGEVFVGDGGDWSTTLEEILKALDVAATPPDKLALLYTTIHTESAVVRCLPGSGDVLPTDAVEVWRKRPCEPPKLVEERGKRLLTFIEERYPDPQHGRDDHAIWFTRLEIADHDLDSVDGEGLMRLDPAAPRPAALPPLPEMTAPPDWVAAPVKAPAELSAKLCAAAQAEIAGLAGRRCEAYGYPSLALPTGTFYYLANDAGQRYRWALQRPDGTISATLFETRDQALLPIIKSYDPAAVPPDKLLAAHLLLSGTPARILCLPGAGDQIPDHECTPPSAKQEGEELIVKAILLELSIPGDRGGLADPAIRSMETSFSPGGGSLGGGFRLVDLREDAEE